MKPVLGLILGLLLCTPPARAADQQLAYWTHGVWHVQLFRNLTHGNRTCQVWTGGDGAGRISLYVGDTGGDAAFVYSPVTYRGQPSPFARVTGITLLFDGRHSWVGDELEMFDYFDDAGHPMADAAVNNAPVAEAVRRLRASNTLVVGAIVQGQTRIYDSFLLEGFTATWLKASEWCRFDAAKQFYNS